jgi:hypothetical protein
VLPQAVLFLHILPVDGFVGNATAQHRPHVLVPLVKRLECSSGGSHFAPEAGSRNCREFLADLENGIRDEWRAYGRGFMEGHAQMNLEKRNCLEFRNVELPRCMDGAGERAMCAI